MHSRRSRHIPHSGTGRTTAPHSGTGRTPGPHCGRRISGPLLFSVLVSTGKLSDGALAFAIGAAMMTAVGIGVKAERQGLEDIAKPLTGTEP